MTATLSNLRSLYITGEEIRAGLPPGASEACIQTAFGTSIRGTATGTDVRFGPVPVGTHALQVRSASGELLAEDFVSVRNTRGDDPILGFATSFDPDAIPSTLSWLARLRCTVVQLYDWMESYSSPLGPRGCYRDRLGRTIDRVALERLIAGIRSQGAVPQAYAPICAADPGAHPDWRLYRNDGAPESLGDLLEIMDPGNQGWQRYWVGEYGRAADTLDFGGFHLDTYGYPRCGLSGSGQAVPIADGYRAFVQAVRDDRPGDVLSFNQVNGVPGAFETPVPPAFRYVEVWPPNDRWRHLEGLMARSAGVGAGSTSSSGGGVLAIYPPVWEGDRESGLRTAVLTEAVATALGMGALIWGDSAAALHQPYYVDHTRLDVSEAAVVLSWHLFALRVRDLFRTGEDSSWCELADENAAVTVVADPAAAPEPLAGSLFVRIRRTVGSIAVSLLDLSGSADGSWRQQTGPGRCRTATVSVLLPSPERWRAEAAVLGHAHARFHAIGTDVATHREGQAIRCQVPLVDGWSVLRIRDAGT